jgi:hypothetical protein
MLNAHANAIIGNQVLPSATVLYQGNLPFLSSQEEERRRLFNLCVQLGWLVSAREREREKEREGVREREREREKEREGVREWQELLVRSTKLFSSTSVFGPLAPVVTGESKRTATLSLSLSLSLFPLSLSLSLSNNLYSTE